MLRFNICGEQTNTRDSQGKKRLHEGKNRVPVVSRKSGAAAIAESLLPRTGRATSRPSELGAARHEIAAYYFGNYHVDPETRKPTGRE